MAELGGRLALVTGASRGIGAATAIALGKAGAHVILTARTAAGLEATEEAVHQAGGTATIAPMDLADVDSIGRLAAAIGGRWDALDILVLNAAILGPLTPVSQLDAKELAQVLAFNVGAQAAMVAAFDPLLRRSEQAAVIGLTSSVGASPRAYWAAYGASKAALETLLLAYGQEVEAVSQIRVAIVDPGATATAMRREAFPGEDQAELKEPEAVGQAILSLVSAEFATGTRLRVGAPVLTPAD